MATPKSSNERIRRKIRGKKVTPKGKDMTGRVVVKKSADNDPRRVKLKEDFLKFYNGEEVENHERFRHLIETLITVGVEAANSLKCPFSISRLNEMMETLGNKPKIMTVIEREVMEPRIALICPHCDEEIGEKESYISKEYRDDNQCVLVHGRCGGLYMHKPVNIEDILGGS